MQARTAAGGRMPQHWRLYLALPALIALAACSNTTTPASTDASSGAVRVAGDGSGSGGAHSVNAVSDALGQRLDGMLSARQAGGGVNR
jgi:hypothetical protein